MTDIPRRLGGPSESRLDRAIDRAVRDLMHVDPRPGFRRRVLAHLEPEAVRSPMFSRVALIGAALAVLILLVTVTTSDWRSELPRNLAQRDAPPVRSAPQPAAPSATPQKVSTDRAPAQISHGEQPARRMTSERIRMPHVTNVFGNRPGTVAAATVDADALWPAAAPQRHEEVPGELPPLVIPRVEPPAPIVIAPLNPRGPGR